MVCQFRRCEHEGFGRYFIRTTHLHDSFPWETWWGAEARESLYWIELLHRNNYIDDKQYNSIYADCEELVKILVARCKKLDQQISEGKWNSAIRPPTSALVSDNLPLTSAFRLRSAFILQPSFPPSDIRHQTSNIKQPLGSNHSASRLLLSLLMSIAVSRLKRSWGEPNILQVSEVLGRVFFCEGYTTP